MNNIKTRNYGIDLLKIFSIFSIVAFHIWEHGGIIDNCETFSVNYNVAWFLNIALYIGVNCFALISGYLMSDRKFKLYGIIPRWLQVLFYTVIGTIIMAFVFPQSVGKTDFIKACLPVIFKEYWYFTAYFGMFFFIPFMNYLLNTLKKYDSLKLITVLLFLFSVLSTLRHGDIFGEASGRSMIWLMVLYYIGGYIKKYDIASKVKTSTAFWIYFGSVAVVFISKIVIAFAMIRITGRPNGSAYVIGNSSPLIVAASICLLLIFSKIKLKNDAVKKMTVFFSNLSFDVYLCHVQPLVYALVLKNMFTGFAKLNCILMVLAVFGASIAIILICTAIGFIRDLIFKLLKINKNSEKFYKFVRGKIFKLKITSSAD